MKHYILENGKPKVANFMAWARWWEDGENRRVDLTQVGSFRVSTVFLGIDSAIDHGRGVPPVPLLFETMVFSDVEGCDGDDLGCWRTPTLGEAKRKHYEIVEKLRDREPPILLEVVET